MNHAPQERQNPSAPSTATDAGRASGSGVANSGGYLVSAETAAQALQECFLANAERGDNAANDELVAKLVHRIRTEQTRGAGTSLPTTAKTTALPHRGDQ